MTNFNNENERKQWESDMDFLAYKGKPNPNVYQWLKDRNIDLSKEDMENVAMKVYRYGYWRDVILYKFSNEIVVIHNTVVNCYYSFEGKQQVNEAFTIARNLGQRYTELGKGLM